MAYEIRTSEIDMSEDAKCRYAFVVDSLERLQNFAYNAKYIHQKNNDEIVIVCIKVDSKWRPIVDALMPNYYWQKIRDQGLEPIARGSALFNICEIIAEMLPDIKDILMEVPPKDYYKCIALDDTGCTVYDIQPIQQIK